MTKTLPIAASLVMLMTISGQALAEPAASDSRHETAASTFLDRQAVDALNAVDRSAATETDAINAYRYHGGPKSDD